MNALWHNAVLLLVLCLAWTASAATLTVTNNADAGPGSLRQAIADAAAGDTIAFDASLTNQTITLTNGQLTVDKSLTIDAAGLDITIDGNDGNGTLNGNRIFEFASGTTNQLAGLTLTRGVVVGSSYPTNSGGAILLDSGATLTITNSTLANNSAKNTTAYYHGGGGAICNDGGMLILQNATLVNNAADGDEGDGGGIFNSGTLILQNAMLANNSVDGVDDASGGGIYSSGTLTILNSTLANNSAGGDNSAGGGGGIFNSGALTVINSALANNSAGSGGGIENEGGGTLTIINSTLVNNASLANSGYYGGGGIYNLNTLTIINSTLVNNSAYGYGGGGIYNNGGGTLSLTNTIVAQNWGGNIQDNGSNTTISHCLTYGVPLLAPLGNYGGPTQTMPPLAGSPAINAGDDSVTNFLATDQRGFPRVVNGVVDIGAVESDYALNPEDFTVVTSASDTLNELTNDGVSLREAMAFAANGSRITFSPALTNSTITLTNGQLTADKSLDINAAGLGITIDGNGTVTTNRIMEFASGTTNQLNGLTLNNGRVVGNGGAILLNSGATLTITNCTLANNTTVPSGSYREGGGIYNRNGTLTIINSTLVKNQAAYGGGIYNDSGGTLTIISSTLANNTATGYGSYGYVYGGEGGGIWNGGTLTMINSTLANNNATYGSGGGIYASGTLSLTNTIVAQNSAGTGPNIYGGGSISHCLINGVPLLAPLGNYGGPTQTMPPLPGSPAIDAGTATSLTTDQRGFPRVAGSAVDIGAVEIQGVSDTESILGSAWSTDNDGDGNPFGVEFALGTDWQTADATNPANLAIRPTNGFPAVAFGLNPAATNYVQWVVYRSLDLAATNSFVEIYRYDGPTGMAYTNGVPVSVNRQGNLLQVIDESNPRPAAAFYRLGVKEMTQP